MSLSEVGLKKPDRSVADTMNKVPPFEFKLTKPNEGWSNEFVFSIDNPRPGAIVECFVVNFKGFVAPRSADSPLPRHLIFLVNGGQIWKAEINLHRPDLARSTDCAYAARMNYCCGFDTVLPCFLNATQGDIQVCVVAEADQKQVRFPLVSVSFSSNQTITNRSNLGVLTINSIGRSGSSILCKMLSAHPLMYSPAYNGQYGEVFLVGHLARTIAVYSSEGAHSRMNRWTDEPDFAVFSSGFNRIDLNQDGLELKLSEDLLRASLNGALSIANNSFEVISQFVNDCKPDVEWWVEKTWSSPSAPLIGLMAREWRELILVRNPIDFVQSQISFLKKHKIPAKDFQLHLEHTAEKFFLIFQNYLAKRDFAYLLKYEDLVQTTEVAMRGVLKYLDLEADDPYLKSCEDSLNQFTDFKEGLSSDSRRSDEAMDFWYGKKFQSKLGLWFDEMCDTFGYR